MCRRKCFYLFFSIFLFGLGGLTFAAGDTYLNLIWTVHQPFYPPQSALKDCLRPDLWNELNSVYNHLTILKNYPQIKVGFSLPPAFLVNIKELQAASYFTRLQKEADNLTAEDKKDILGCFLNLAPAPELSFPRSEQMLTTQNFVELLGWFEKQQGKISDLFSLLEELTGNQQLEIIGSPYAAPALGLLVNTDLAKINSQPVPPAKKFSYPEDAYAQIIKGMEVYRSIRNFPVSGLFLRDGTVGSGILEKLQESQVKWVIEPYRAVSPLLKKENENFIRPPSIFKEGDREIVFIFAFDGGPNWPGKKLSKEIAGLMEKQKKEENSLVAVILPNQSAPREGALSDFYKELSSLPCQPITVSEYLRTYPPQEKFIWGLPLKPDFAPWVGPGQQNLAWDYLRQARESLEKYKNSGKATVEGLESGFDYLYKAEGGDWFLSYGQTPFNGQLDYDWRTLVKGIYESTGQEVPAYLLSSLDLSFNTGFSPKVTADENEDYLVHFVDPSGDDYGPGTYTYPLAGVFSPGLFDLAHFSVKENLNEIIFKVGLNQITNPWNGPAGFSLQTIDVYIDLNHRLGAGKVALFPGRSAFTRPEEAWEYALIIDGWQAEIYKAGIYEEPEKLSRLKVEVENDFIVVYVPKEILSGSPLNWGYVVGVLGYDNSGENRIRKIESQATQLSFGGLEAQAASPLIDILNSSAEKQKVILGASRKGKKIEIPAVRVK